MIKIWNFRQNSEIRPIKISYEFHSVIFIPNCNNVLNWISTCRASRLSHSRKNGPILRSPVQQNPAFFFSKISLSVYWRVNADPRVLPSSPLRNKHEFSPRAPKLALSGPRRPDATSIIYRSSSIICRRQIVPSKRRKTTSAKQLWESRGFKSGRTDFGTNRHRAGLIYAGLMIQRSRFWKKSLF